MIKTQMPCKGLIMDINRSVKLMTLVCTYMKYRSIKQENIEWQTLLY